MVRAETSEKQRENEGRGGTYLGRVRKRGKTEGEATHTLGGAENTGKRGERKHIPWEGQKTKGEAAHTLIGGKENWETQKTEENKGREGTYLWRDIKRSERRHIP